MPTLIYHPGKDENSRGYYTVSYGHKWFAHRKNRNKQQRKSRKLNRR